jgi:hypothetical protein
MPRYAPRAALRTRLSSVEHPEGSDLALTALDRSVVRVEIREPKRPPSPPAAEPPRPPPTRSPLAWAPWIAVAAIALGVIVGGLVAALR